MLKGFHFHCSNYWHTNVTKHESFAALFTQNDFLKCTKINIYLYLRLLVPKTRFLFISKTCILHAAFVYGMRVIPMSHTRALCVCTMCMRSLCTLLRCSCAAHEACATLASHVMRFARVHLCADVHSRCNRYSDFNRLHSNCNVLHSACTESALQTRQNTNKQNTGSFRTCDFTRTLFLDWVHFVTLAMKSLPYLY